MLYLKTVFSLMHDISTNSAPRNISDHFTCSSDVHTYKPDLRNVRKKRFKNKIHQFLLAVLGNEDNYVDVSTFMLKITNYH